MKAHIDAIKALISPLYPAFYVDVPKEPTYPYVLLWSSVGIPGNEPAVGCNDDLDDTLGVTVAGLTADSVLIVAKRIRGVLDKSNPIVPGRSAELRLYDSRPLTADTTVTIPDHDRNPIIGVDLYRLTSTPA